MSREHFHPILTKLLRRVWNSRADQEARVLLFKVVQTVDVVAYALPLHALAFDASLTVRRPSEADFEIMREIVTSSMRDVAILNGRFKQCLYVPALNSDTALKYQCFLLAGAHPERIQAPTASALLQGIRHWLVSEDPNELYAFVSCLTCLEPALWAGQGDIPTILEAWEIERVINLLYSEDPLVRLKVERPHC